MVPRTGLGSPRGRPVEAKARVIGRVSDHDNELEVCLCGTAEPVRDESGTRALALVLRKDAHRRQRQDVIPRAQDGPAECNVSDDRAVAKRDEAKLRHVGAGSSQRVDQIRFFMSRAKARSCTNRTAAKSSGTSVLTSHTRVVHHTA